MAGSSREATTNALAPALDTLALVETPEGVVLRLAPAGMIPRALALLLDLTLAFVLQTLLAMALVRAFGGASGGMEGFGAGLWMILAFVLQWLYPVLCEVFWNGQTVGKRALGLRVVHDDGSPVRLPASLARNLLWIVDVVFGAAFAFVAMLASTRFQRIGDLVAGTLVVHVEPVPVVLPLPPLAPLPSSVRLTQTEQALIVRFAERSAQLSQERQVELAELLVPLHAEHGDAAVLALRRMAVAILGPAQPSAH